MSEPTKSAGKLDDLARNPRTWIALAIAVVAVAFIAQNRDPVTSSLLMLEFTSPQWVTLLIVFLAGLLTGVLLRRKRKH